MKGFLSPMSALITFSVCVSALAADSAQVKAWKRYQSAGEKAFKARDSIQAEKQFLLAVGEAERLPKGESRLRESLRDLGPLLLSHRKYNDAQAAFARLGALYEKEFGSNHLRVSEALVGLGAAFSYGDRYPEAEAALLRARKIIEIKLGASHPNIAHVDGSLAAVYRYTGRFDQAETLYKTAIAIAESPRFKTEFVGSEVEYTRYRPRYDMAAGLMNDLALLYQARARFSDAETMFKRSLKTFESVSGTQGDGTAMVLHNLGLLLLREKRFADSEPLLRRALGLRQKAFGSAHPIVAESMEALASAVELQNPDEANKLCARAREIRASSQKPLTARP